MVTFKSTSGQLLTVFTFPKSLNTDTSRIPTGSRKENYCMQKMSQKVLHSNNAHIPSPSVDMQFSVNHRNYHYKFTTIVVGKAVTASLYICAKTTEVNVKLLYNYTLLIWASVCFDQI